MERQAIRLDHRGERRLFPGPVEGLVADPGCRVILYDRPGTGTSTEPGSLAGAAASVKTAVDDLGLVRELVARVAAAN